MWSTGDSGRRTKGDQYMQPAAELGMILGDWIWGSKRRGEDLYLDT